MGEAQKIKEVYDYDGLLIDPYNSLAKDAALLRSVGGHEYDYQIASEMRLFCKKNSVFVAHLKMLLKSGWIEKSTVLT